MIDTGTQPCSGVMTHIAGLCGLDMACGFADSDAAIVAAGAGTNHSGMVYASHGLPDNVVMTQVAAC
jgi:hypothetical protein